MRGPERFYLACAFRTRAKRPSSSTSSSTHAKLDAMRTMGREAMLRASDADDASSDGVLFDEDKALVLDALERQASHGPAHGARPWDLFDPQGALAYDAWKMLGDIAPERAMEIYCEVIQMAYPDWFDILVRGMSEKQKRTLIATAKECALEYYRALARGELGESAKASTSKDARRVLSFDSSASPTAFLDEIFATAADDVFAKLPILDKTVPKARSGHVCALVHGDTLFVSHGKGAKSRLLADLWGFDLSTGMWAERRLTWPGSPCAGMATAIIDCRLYAFRGKGADDCDATGVYVLNVSMIDLSADYRSNDQQFKWTHIRAAVSDGEDPLPRARRAHTATVVGDSIVIFGGVDSMSGDDTCECWLFDTNRSTWKRLMDGLRARSSHTAVCVDDRYLVVCGGTNGNELCECSDVDVYDVVENRWWTAPRARDGDAPSPRASHVGIAVADRYFIIGGGNNERALHDAFVLDLRACVDERRCAKWSVFAQSCPIIGREGMSACAVTASSSGRTYLLLHGGSNETASAVNDTIACRLSL